MRRLFEEARDLALAVKSLQEVNQDRVRNLIIKLNQKTKEDISPREKFRDISTEELCFILYNLGVILKRLLLELRFHRHSFLIFCLSFVFRRA